MKQLFSLFLILTISLGFVSCKKEELTPGKVTVTPKQPNTSIVGPVWVLYSGRVYVENISNGGSKGYYDHFGPTRPISNTDIFSPSTIPFDNIEKDVTTWQFTSSQFILNGVNSYQYEFHAYSSSSPNDGTYRPYGLENGSARPIEILSSTSDYMNVKICEGNGSSGLYDYAFFTVLTFVRQGFSGTPIEQPYSPTSWPYQGVIPPPTQNPTGTDLVNTKWVVTKYVQNFVSQTISDTLFFVNSNKYTINGSLTRNYTLTNITGNNMKSLSLYSFTTLGGDYSGQVQGTFITDGVVNNALFTNIFNSNLPDSRIWMTRIQ